ncbi:MAG: 3-isopropylmalate dehydrogenase [Candidatus Caenarcaniphilales bacterium]|nr:3-isopropylmalate dehydrogenase [Candidatus Caenarcaniphilales bacterium]
MSTKKILVLEGDGIGPEITVEALKVLNLISSKTNTKFEIVKGLMGGQAIDETGDPLPSETKSKLKEVDAVLLAAIGGPKWESLPNDKKPEKGLLGLRKELEAFANIRPAKVFSCLADSSTLKREVIDGVDLVVVRELTGGIYFGQPRGMQKVNGETVYLNTAVYSEAEVRRILKCACEQAMLRKKKLCSVDKANVLEVSQFWRDIAIDFVSKNFPEIELSHMYVDNAAMQLIRNPKQFDVIVTSNLFGDILSDEASMLTGSIGLLPSASLGDGSKPGLYEPVHGSAPDIAGQKKANPIAMILSLAMLLENTYAMSKEARAIEKAIENVLNRGLRTADIAKAGEKTVNTSEMGEAICVELGVLV